MRLLEITGTRWRLGEIFSNATGQIDVRLKFDVSFLSFHVSRLTFSTAVEILYAR
ncbi:MAG: hypothetical protein JWQ40_1561 [Segetibacter sp.]|jgi:hypothetical protein|nr:hypothetical protein [Segetibacter sp.]